LLAHSQQLHTDTNESIVFFLEKWNFLLLRRHLIPRCLAVPPFFVRRSTNCYLQLNFLIPLRNSATCTDCYTVRVWPNHWLASLLLRSQMFFLVLYSTFQYFSPSNWFRGKTLSIQILWLLSSNNSHYKNLRVRLTAYLRAS
jgi:hypothetical protein